MKTRFILMAILVSISYNLIAQSNSLYNRINGSDAFQDNKLAVQLFSSDSSKNFRWDISHGELLGTYKVEISDLEKLINSSASFLELDFPLLGQRTIIQLEEYKLLTDDFYLSLSRGGKESYSGAYKFYHGTIAGQENSVASLSYIDGTIKMVLSGKFGNVEISKHRAVYAAFSPNVEKSSGDFSCEYLETGKKKTSKWVPSQNHSFSSSCIEVYVEADHRTFLDHGSSSTQVMNWMMGVFNEVAMVYANEGISIKLSEVHVWNTPDPFASFPLVDQMLIEFGKYRKNNYNGRLAHLVSTRNINSGIAWIDVLCQQYDSFNHSGPYGVSTGLNTGLVPFPSYSWNVNALAHELGHNFGARHTHDCVWGPAKNEQIDDCASHYATFNPKPACYDPFNPVLPIEGGTLMSYCNIGPVGINLSNGFGPEPGMLILQNFNSASCLNNGPCGGEQNNPISIVCPSNYTGSLTCVSNLDINPVVTGQAIANGGNGNNNINFTDNQVENTNCNYEIHRTWIATEASGSSDQCIQIINFKDDQQPQISNCPGTIVVDILNGCQAIASWNQITASDNCDSNVGISTNYTSGSFFPVGTTQVNVIANDHCNNSSNCFFNVLVRDKQDPIFINCPSNITIQSNSSCNAIVQWSVPTAEDNCQIDGVNSNHNPGDTFPLGQTEVVYVAEDESGNTATCSFTIIVEDQCTPSINIICPDNYLSTNACPDGVVIHESHSGSASANGGSGILNINYTDQIVLNSPCETRLSRIWTASDQSVNQATCMQQIVVKDDLRPVITGVQTFSSYSCNEQISFDTPNAADACTNVSLSFADTTEEHPQGTVYIRTWTATDECGNTSTASQRVIPVLDSPPIINMTFMDTAFHCGIIPVAVEPPVTDDCAVVSLTYTESVSGQNCAGNIISRVWVATDEAGNSTSAEQSFTPTDQIPPELHFCPSDQTHEVQSSCKAIASWSQIQFTDDCSVINISEDHVSGQGFSIGQNIVSVTATDACGNQTTCSFEIMVVDTEAPLLANCPGDMIIDSNGECTAVVSWTIPDVSDHCDYTLSSTYEPGHVFEIGSYEVIYSAEDNTGNTSSCSFMIEILDACSEEFIIICPDEFVSDYHCSELDTMPQMTGIAQFANNEGAVRLEYADEVLSNNACGLELNRRWRATDQELLLEVECFQLIILVDNEAPSIDACPENIIAELSVDCMTSVEWVLPSATDNCSQEITFESNYASGDFFAIGESEVIFSITDECGNVALCSFMINAMDTSPPLFVNCPSTIVVESDEQCIGHPEWSLPEITDACNYTLTASHEPGSKFMLGITEVSLTATDEFENISSCHFLIEVIDACSNILRLEAPSDTLIFANCLSANVDTVAMGVASFTGGEGTVDIEFVDSILIDDSCTRLIKRNWMGIDSLQNLDSAFQLIEIVDNVGPEIISVPEDIIIQAGHSCSAFVDWEPARAIDSCGSFSNVEYSHPQGMEFEQGYTGVIVTATDSCGNQSSTYFTIEVQQPVLDMSSVCPGNMDIYSPDSLAMQVYWDEPEIEDCFGNYTMSSSHQNGAMFEIGVTAVIYNIENESGDSDFCYFMINVIPPKQWYCQDSINMTQLEIKSGLYAAGNKLSISGRIKDQSDVTLTAGDTVSMFPGFEIRVGAEFEARIDSCGIK